MVEPGGNMTTINDMALTDWTETKSVLTGMQHLTDRATRDALWEHILTTRDEDV